MKTKLTKKMLSLFLAVLMVISALPFTAVTASAADPSVHDNNEVFGYIDIDPIIYVHGDYTGTSLSINSKKGDMYDYMMYGDQIADGTAVGECKTMVSVNGKTISNIEVIDTGAQLSLVNVSGGMAISGNLKGGYGDIDKNGADSKSTATIKFTFTDGTYEYHKLPVKTNPVAAHAVVASHNWRNSWGTENGMITFVSTAKGSYGTGTGSGKTTSGGTQRSGTSNYAYMYSPYDSNKDIDVWEDSGIRIDSMTDGIGGFDKIAGYAYTGHFNANGIRGVMVTSPVANYYLDLSSSKNYGVEHTTGNNSYKLRFIVGNAYSGKSANYYGRAKKGIVSDGTYDTSTPELVSRTSGTSSLSVATSAPATLGNNASSVGEVVLSGNAVKGESNFTYRLGYTTNSFKGSCEAIGQNTIPIKLTVTDKTDIRNNYNSYINNLKNGSIDLRCVTSSTKSTFLNALLSLEEYLNDNTDTSDGSTLNNAVNTAYNQLDRSAHTPSTNFFSKVDDKTYHYKKCSVCNELIENQKAEHTYTNKIKTPATCTTQGEHTYTCSTCGYSFDSTDIAATGHAYAVSGNRYVCTNDPAHIKTDANKGEPIELDNYNAAVTEANAKLQETDVYTEESRKSLQDALNLPANQLDAKNDKTQGEVDAKTTKIQTAITNLELLVVKYNVQFMYQFQGEEPVEVINASYDKDEEIELKVPEDALAQGVVYKWYTSTTDGDKPYATSVNSTTLIVNKHITIVAKLQKNTTDVTSAVKVNLLDKSGKTIAIAYTSNSSITLGESSITVDGNELEAKQIPFYNVRGFKVDGGAALSSTTYDIPAGVTEINVMPNYVAEKKIVITVDSDVKLNGKSVSSYEATWNQAITMTAETEVNWYANGKLIAQGTTYKFCANADVIITAETAEPATTDPSVEIGYFNYDSSLNKVTVVSNFYAPQGTISDAGVILSTKTSDVETLKKATGGVFKVNSGNFTSNGNQVKISVSRTATTQFTMHALAFVVVNGKTYYADSVATCEYK